MVGAEVIGSLPCICQRSSHISAETTAGNDIHQSFVMFSTSFKQTEHMLDMLEHMLDHHEAESLRVTLDNAVQLNAHCYLYLIMVLMPVGYFNTHLPEKSRVGCPLMILMDVSCLNFSLIPLGFDLSAHALMSCILIPSDAHEHCLHLSSLFLLSIM